MRHNALDAQNSQNGHELPLWRSWRNGPRLRLLAAIAAVAALLLSANTSSQAAAASTPSESAILISALPKYTCPAGTVKLTPASARRTAHGADVYHYSMTSGPGFNSYVPPAGFNPLAASNAVLSEMNMPARPAKASALTAWKKAMSGYKGTKQPELCANTTPISEPAGKPKPLSRASGPEASLASATGKEAFSGYVDPNSGYPFTAVGALWNQPAPANDNASQAYIWVGIGGWYTGNLLQDGTTSPGNNGSVPYAFWEYLGAGKHVGVQDVAEVSPGDEIEAQVYYSTASSGTATFYVHVNGALVLNEQETDVSADYDPSTVDFFVERQTSPNLPLTNTGTIYFSDANGQDSLGAVPVGSSGVIGVVMTTNGLFVAPPCTPTTMLEYPNTLSTDSFEEHFCRS
jgi:Peptidase A4 family